MEVTAFSVYAEAGRMYATVGRVHIVMRSLFEPAGSVHEPPRGTSVGRTCAKAGKYIAVVGRLGVVAGRVGAAAARRRVVGRLLTTKMSSGVTPASHFFIYTVAQAGMRKITSICLIGSRSTNPRARHSK